MADSKPSYNDSVASDKDAASDEYYAGTGVHVEPVKESTQRPEGALGDAVLRFLHIRKGPPRFDPDAVGSLSPRQSLTFKIATQPSIWDSENVEEYKALYISDKWENRDAFDPAFRWTWREEAAVRRKVDWKIMVSCSWHEAVP